MKRAIFLGFLITTIVGLGALSINSKIEVNKMCDKTLVDLAGDRHALGDKKLSIKTNLVNEYEYLETIISQNGVEAENNVEGDLYYLENNKNFQSIDRKLVRGFNTGNTSENERYAVALKHESTEGLTIRYKNKETKKYGEFSIEDKDLMTWLELSNVYVKDDIAYAILSSYEGSRIFKISLSSEKILKRIDFPVLTQVRGNYRGYNNALVKDNKMYIIGGDRTPDYGFMVFTFDLDKEILDYKKVEGLSKNVEEKHCHINSIERDDNYAYYSVFYDNKKNIDIVVYDILKDKLMEFSMDNKSINKLEHLSIKNCRLEENKVYLSGSYMFDDRRINSYISVFDINKKSLEYLGYIDEKLLYPNSTVELR